LEKTQLAINRLLNAERRLTALLNEVSLVSKDQSGRLSFTPEKWNIRLLTDDLLEQIDYLLQPNVNVKILESDNRQALMDKNLLTHILGNFVSNAIKYTSKGNSIEVVIGLNHNDEYEIRVIDQGVGIPKEEQQSLFDPYFRASNSKDVSGTGLGLNIVKRCVELHGGQITLNSEEGKGTEIAVTIPI
jgi:signal transduction histidine kinase